MRNISSWLKVLPDNWVSVSRIRVGIHWLVDNQWICVLAFDFNTGSLSVCEEVLTEEEEEKKAQKKKQKNQKQRWPK